jgi:hypothetical protein
LVASNLIAAATIVVSMRLRKLTPASGWALVAAFCVCIGVGNIVYFVNDSILDVVRSRRSATRRYWAVT